MRREAGEGHPELLEYVNEAYAILHSLQCAECESRCGYDDYLCSTCRSSTRA
jgi:hypothetical protein